MSKEPTDSHDDETLDLDVLNDWDFYIATGIDRTLTAPSGSSQETPKA